MQKRVGLACGMVKSPVLPWYVLPLLCHCPHTIPPCFLLYGLYFFSSKDLQLLCMHLCKGTGAS